MEKIVKIWSILYILATLAIVNGARMEAKNAPSNPPSSDCNDLIFDMVDCISYLQTGKSDPKPSATCCSGFETILQTDAKCVCDGFKSAAGMGISINMTKAANLASMCHTSAPPISACNISIAPQPSPAPPTINPPPTTTPPATNLPPSSSPTPTPPKGAPAGSPPPTPPPSSSATPPSTSPSPTSGNTPAGPTTPSPEANSPQTAGSPSHAPSPKSAGTSTTPMFIISSIMVVAPFLV